MNDSTSFRLHKEIEAAKILKADLSDLVRDDPDFLTSVIEGETSLLETIDALVFDIKSDEALVRGIGGAIADLKARKDKIENRSDMKRSLVAKAMELAEIKKREAPAGTVSLKRCPPTVILTDESLVPPRFWKRPAPTLDRAALGIALRADVAVPGATLGNGSLTISIRT